jgi:hypothetical protein
MEQCCIGRKYRPQTFKDVGTKAITNTLLNAIESNHLASIIIYRTSWCWKNNLCPYFGSKNKTSQDMMIPMKILLLMFSN